MNDAEALAEISKLIDQGDDEISDFAILLRIAKILGQNEGSK